MQKVKVADISIKKGTNDKGPWTNTRVTGEDGAVFGTFSESAQYIAKGDLIELEPVVKGKNINFSEWNLIEKATGATVSPESPPAPSGDRFKRDTEGIRFEYQCKAQLQAIERASIEGQTAYNGIIELAKVYREDPDLNETFKEAIAWARAKMAATLATSAPSEATGAKSESDQSEPQGKALASSEEKAPEVHSFPHVGALLAWCAENGVDRPTFLKINGADEKGLPKIIIDDAYQAVLQYLSNRPDPGGEVPF